MNGAGGEDGGHRNSGAAVFENEDLGCGGRSLVGEAPAGTAEPLPLVEGRVERRRAELGNGGRKHEEAVELQEPRCARVLTLERRATAEQCPQRHHGTLAQVVDRRIGHLCEPLPQVRRHGSRATGQRRQRCVVSHRGHGLVTGRRRRTEEEEDVLAREPDPHLAGSQVLRRRFDRHACVEGTDAGTKPAHVGALAREPSLDSRALLDTERGVDDEHLAWSEPPAPDADALGERKGARFRGAGDEAVVGNGVAEGPQAVAVERCADDAPVCEDDPGRAVPRLE